MIDDKPRSQQVCLEATPYYHCVSRCVRKAYLCGIDFFTKQSYEHRRAWLEQEILKQAQVLGWLCLATLFDFDIVCQGDFD